MSFKNSISLILIVLGFSFSCLSQDLIPYRVGEKWGYADENGTLIYEATHDSVSAFKWNKSLKAYGSLVFDGEKSIYINKANKPIFDADYKNIHLLSFREWIIAEGPKISVKHKRRTRFRRHLLGVGHIP